MGNINTDIVKMVKFVKCINFVADMLKIVPLQKLSATNISESKSYSNIFNCDAYLCITKNWVINMVNTFFAAYIWIFHKTKLQMKGYFQL